MNKLNWKEIQDLIGEPVYDKKSNMWRVIDSYKYEDDKYSISFTDLTYWKNFNDVELYKEKFVQEKEKILTEEEREFLKQVLRFMEIRILSISIDKDIESNTKKIHFNQNKDGSGLGYWYYIKNNTFNKLELDKVYTLEELGLD